MGLVIARNTLFLALIWILACLLVSPAARASVSNKPHFKVEGQVIVWGTQGSSSGQIGREVKTMPFPHAQPLSVVPALTGTLEPLSQPDLFALDHRQRSFYVASNTAFAIDAELTGHSGMTIDELASTQVDLSVSLGQSAQYPHAAGPRGGIHPDIRTLADLAVRTRVFTGNQRTAARAGTIAQQSVQFDLILTETVRKPSKLAETTSKASEIVFTVFVP